MAKLINFFVFSLYPVRMWMRDFIKKGCHMRNYLLDRNEHPQNFINFADYTEMPVSLGEK